MRINPRIANQMYLNSGNEESSCLPSGTYTTLAAAKYIKDNDKDGDKCLSADEVKISAEAFKRLDADGDGKLTLEEMKKSLAGQDDAIFKYYKNGGSNTTDITSSLLSGSNSGTGASGTYSTLAASRYLKDKDKNGDGVLSSEELSLTAEIFKTLDKDGDGKITKAELNSALASQDSTIQKYYKNGGTSSIIDLTTRLLGKI